jgi:hypothetical protein
MKLCKDCRYFKAVELDDFDECVRPRLNPVSGLPMDGIIFCKNERAPDRLPKLYCGIWGDFFKKK